MNEQMKKALPAPSDEAMLSVPRPVFDRLAPLSLWAHKDGYITHLGPTLRKILGEIAPKADVFSLFDFRQPRGLTSLEGIQPEGIRVLLRLERDPTIGFRGLALPMGEEVFFQLAMGIGLLQRLGNFNLTAGDLSPADLTSEVLYLLEAQSTVLNQSRDLNRRLEEARAQARRQALTDPLTGLWNRRALLDLLETLTSSRRREEFALMQIDLDHFKRINDTLGHAAGDHVLKEVAKILRSETRREDLVARVGGDEFILVFRSVHARDQLDTIARRIISRIEKPIPFEGEVCEISASIGSTFSHDYARLDIDTLLEDADLATYASKRTGRGRHTLFDPSMRE